MWEGNESYWPLKTWDRFGPSSRGNRTLRWSLVTFDFLGRVLETPSFLSSVLLQTWRIEGIRKRPSFAPVTLFHPSGTNPPPCMRPFISTKKPRCSSRGHSGPVEHRKLGAPPFPSRSPSGSRNVVERSEREITVKGICIGTFQVSSCTLPPTPPPHLFDLWTHLFLWIPNKNK